MYAIAKSNLKMFEDAVEQSKQKEIQTKPKKTQ